MRKSGKFLAAALSFALVLATPLSAQATKSGLSDAKSKKTALEAEKKKTEQELRTWKALKAIRRPMSKSWIPAWSPSEMSFQSLAMT